MSSGAFSSKSNKYFSFSRISTSSFSPVSAVTRCHSTFEFQRMSSRDARPSHYISRSFQHTQVSSSLLHALPNPPPSHASKQNHLALQQPSLYLSSQYISTLPLYLGLTASLSLCNPVLAPPIRAFFQMQSHLTKLSTIAAIYHQYIFFTLFMSLQMQSPRPTASSLQSYDNTLCLRFNASP